MSWQLCYWLFIPLLPLLILRHFAFGLHFGEFGFFPAAAAFGTDAVEEDGGRFDVGMLRAPVGGEVASEGGRQDGLAELFEQRRNGLERSPGFAAPLLQRLNFGDDAALFGEGGIDKGTFLRLPCVNLSLVVPLTWGIQFNAFSA